MPRFDSKTIIITGSGSGIGAATAIHFSREGANVVILGRTKAKLAETVRHMDEDRTLSIACDVSKPRDVETMVRATVKRFGGLDVLVNNAGIFEGGPITEATTDQWKKVMAIDVDGVFYCCRAAVPHLIERKGCIVNVSSVSGLGGDWNASPYNAAKGAITNFTRSLAMELGDKGVRVNAVNPSLTFTDMTADMKKDKALLKKFYDRIPMRRAAEPEDIAPVIAFLASDDARFVTGVNLPVDGGLSASNGQPKMM
ncbi:MAG: SDR family oxidoreductase [Phycisphaerae bacterium]|nr:SDR family oxidoreductase [Phycisphaerae bacterium]